MPHSQKNMTQRISFQFILHSQQTPKSIFAYADYAPKSASSIPANAASVAPQKTTAHAPNENAPPLLPELAGKPQPAQYPADAARFHAPTHGKNQ